MEAFVSGILGELRLSAVVTEVYHPFGMECKDMNDEENNKNMEKTEKKEIRTLHSEELILEDNVTLSERLRGLHLAFPDAYAILVPPHMEIDPLHIIPVMDRINDHIAVMREGSAVMVNPDTHFDIKIDRHCYIIIPPRLLAKYSGNAPEPLHLIVYVIAIVITCILVMIAYKQIENKESK